MLKSGTSVTKDSDVEAKPHPLLQELKSSQDEEMFWENVSAKGGSPLIQMQENGQYQVTFLYRSKVAKRVELESEDLYERMLDENDNPKCFEKISGTDTFVLQLDNIPADAFCFYNIKVDGKVIFPEHEPKGILPVYSIEDTTQVSEKATIVSHESKYLQLPEASVPKWTVLNPADVTHGTIERDSIEDPTNALAKRDIWVYKPPGYNENDAKVIFILDGEHFLKSLTPYIDSLNQDEANPLANAAIVFVDSNMRASGHYGSSPIPDRVHEFYYQTEKFSKFMTDEVIPKYCQKLQGEKSNPNNVILAAHSLAAYPVINVAKENPGKIGGVILLSPALNQKKEHDLPENPPMALRELPIYMQIGQLESAKPPEICQRPDYKDMTDQSRIDSNRIFHEKLEDKEYKVSPLRVHSSGHGGIHVVDGLVEGLQFLNSCRKEETVVFEQEAEQQPVKTLVKQYQTYIDQNKQDQRKQKTEDVRDDIRHDTGSKRKFD
ncbi:MAG: alpha/beta hydrolase-fold protein [Candidatus Babeliales bacterium]|uniref:Enterobactin/ferric enterobactin esterase n=1 Tax=Candidatus Berkiella aquae TaxID=295108 RepID=A0A0Q9Y9E0_9GAMM|nr:alpha/beta hydrolase-fold protein [Candidatus Berkiella aquae]MCS5712923.1 hypothetical protein [Candidatus Berkiella aquae]